MDFIKLTQSNKIWSITDHYDEIILAVEYIEFKFFYKKYLLNTSLKHFQQLYHFFVKFR